MTRTGTSGGTYTASPAGLNINASKGAVTTGTSTPGTYTVTYTVTNPSGCTGPYTATASITINAEPTATISYGASSYCSTAGNKNVSRTGAAGGTYTASPAGLAIDASTGTVNTSTSAAGTYTVTYTMSSPSGCSGTYTATTSITISAPPSATISYSGSPYCANAGSVSVTRTGTSGGAYTASPAGLTIDATSGTVTAGTSAPGTYTVTYTMANPSACGGGSITTTASITINAEPSATISYAGSPYCSGAGMVSVTRTGTAGGTYSASPAGLSINSSTGAVTTGTSTPGTYTVTYTLATPSGCTGTYQASASVTINAQPTATINYDGLPYCSNAGDKNVTRTGTAGGTYTASPAGLTIDASTGTVTTGTSIPGAYTVTYTMSAPSGCTGSYTATTGISILATPTATISGSATICPQTSSPVTISLTGSPGFNFTYTDGTTPVTIYSVYSSPYTFSGIAGKTYTLTYVHDQKCLGTTSGVAALDSFITPTATISGNSSIMAGASATFNIALTGTPPWNVTYSNGTTPVTQIVSTSPLTVTVSPTSTTNYTLTSVSDAHCSGTMSGTATVSVQTRNGLSFDGVNDYVDATVADLPIGNSPRTIEVWYKHRGGGDGSLVNWGTSTTNHRFGLIDIGGHIYIVGENNDNDTHLSITDSGWHHFATTYDGTTLTVFKDGIDIYNTNKTSFPYNTSGTTLRLGNRVNPLSNEYADGTIDEVRIWNRALCQGEIVANMNGELPDPGSQEGLVAYYKLNQGIAGGNNTGDSIVTDEISSSNNGLMHHMSLNGSTSNWVAGSSAVTGVLTSYTGTSSEDSISYGPDTFCATGTIPVTLTGTMGGVFYGTDGLVIDSVTGTINAQASDPGIHTIKYYVPGSGSCPATTEITLRERPYASLDYYVNPVCPGSPAMLHVNSNVAGAWSFEYTDGVNTYEENNASGYFYTESIYPENSATYSLINVSDPFCSSGTVMGSAYVNVYPAASGFMSGDTTVCENSTATLSISLTGTPPWFVSYSDGSGTYTESGIWSTPYTIERTMTESSMFFLQSVMDAHCTGTVSGGAYVTVLPLPAAVLSGDNTICSGGVAELSVELTGTPPWSVTYNDGDTNHTYSGITSSPFIIYELPASNTVYSLVSVSDAHCDGLASGSATIAIHTQPTGVLSGSASLCAGGSALLSVALTGTAPWSVTYTDGDSTYYHSGITSSPYQFTVAPSSSMTYTLLSVSDAVCSGNGSGAANVTVHPIPTASVSGTTVILAGSSAPVSIALTGTPPWILNYTSEAGTFTDTAYTTPHVITVSPTTTTTYNVATVADMYCSGPGSAAATINVYPVPTATLAGSTTICSGSTAALSVTLTGTPPWMVTYNNGTADSTISGIMTSPLIISKSPTTSTVYTCFHV